MSLPDNENDDYKYEQIILINRISEQFHIEWLQLNFQFIQDYNSSITYNQEYQQIINDVVNYIFDEDQYDLIDDEYLDLNKVKQISSKLQENDFQNYLLSQFEILRKQINKYFFKIYLDPQYQLKIKDKYKQVLIGGTKDFIFVILIQAGITINNKLIRCRLIIIVLNQQDFSIFKRFEENINFKLYTAKLICNYDFNQIAIYTNQVLCFYDVNNSNFIQYEMSTTQNLSVFQYTTILQLDSNYYLNQLSYQNEAIICSQLNSINAYQQPYQMLLYNDFLIIYFTSTVKVIYYKNGKLLQINRNLATITNQKESCISNRSKLVYQTVKIDIQHSSIYMYCLQGRKILRKFNQQEISNSTDIYLMKDKILVAISQDYIEAYETILGKQLLYLHLRKEMASTNQLLQILNSKYLIDLDYTGLLKFWQYPINDMDLLINRMKPFNLQ